MKLYIPFKKWFITQTFGQNKNTYYAENKLLGHTGTDIDGQGNDTTIYASCDGYIYSVINKDNPDLMKYRAVYQLIEDNGIFSELSYGHCSDIYIEPKTWVKRGDKLAKEGNTGDVAVGGRKVTAEEKQNGSNLGNHLHFQLRLVKPVDKIISGNKYLMTSNGFFKKDDNYFEVVNYKNGYNGCVDMKDFLIYESATSNIIPVKPQITQTLRYGNRGDQVKLLQGVLNIKQDGIFGVNTEKALKIFQKSNNLVNDGICGKLTAKVVNNLL